MVKRAEGVQPPARAVRAMIGFGLVARLALMAEPAGADTRVWARASGTGDWYSALNWDGGVTCPAPGDSVVVSNGFVLLTNSTPDLTALTITNASLIFTNWTTALRAGDITIRSRAVLTLPPAFTTSQPPNRIWLVCSNLTLDPGAALNVDARGYANDNGPGRGLNGAGCGGAGHGGKGGRGSAAAEGLPYGSASAPLDPGSGAPAYGGAAQYVGSHGGGAVRIEASGAVTINGTVSANGGNLAGPNPSNYGAGAAGGSIFITCASFGGGTSGVLRANGGNGGSVGGGGGGGRIAVDYQGLVGSPGVRCSANRGSGWVNVDVSSPLEPFAPQVGTLWFPDPALVERAQAAWAGSGLAEFNGYLFFAATSNWAPASLTLSNSTLGLPEGARWQITNDLTMTASGVIVGPHGRLSCGGNLGLTRNSSLLVYGGATNAAYTNGFGASLSVAGTLSLESNCWLYPFSESTNGGSAYLRVGRMAIMNGGGINADGRGYACGAGPGTGGWGTGCGGAGYGGKGGSGQTGAAGLSYGSPDAPLAPGSGAPRYAAQYIPGHHGGGLVWIEAAGDLSIDGTVTANGANGNNPVNYGAGGSGGSIYMVCGSFRGGPAAKLRANGGVGGSVGGGGGGGRIAVWVGVPSVFRERYLAGSTGSVIRSAAVPPAYLGSVSVTNGLGWRNPPDAAGAYPGTAFFYAGDFVRGAVILVR